MNSATALMIDIGLNFDELSVFAAAPMKSQCFHHATRYSADAERRYRYEIIYIGLLGKAATSGHRAVIMSSSNVYAKRHRPEAAAISVRRNHDIIISLLVSPGIVNFMAAMTMTIRQARDVSDKADTAKPSAGCIIIVMHFKPYGGAIRLMKLPVRAVAS